MAVYDQFASIYQQGPYVRFSQALAESIFPDFLASLELTPGSLLDVACGEGSFAVAMAQRGITVTGIDQSPQMIALAQAKAQAVGMDVRFQVEDMRSLGWEGEFDLVTCFFDSLNYLLTINDLREAFSSAFQALKPGGYYIFDMNTIYGLAVDWMRQETYLQNETEDLMEIHRQEFDHENQVATMRITVFRRQGDTWERIDETHHERGYPLADLQFLLHQVGFEIVGMYGGLKQRSEVQTTSPRVWFTARKPK